MSRRPNVNLAVTARSAAAPHASTRSSSDNSDVTENATALLGGSVNATIDAAEYKDTVLFLAQQQQLQHQEMMELMRGVLVAVQRRSVDTDGGQQQQQQQHMFGAVPSDMAAQQASSSSKGTAGAAAYAAASNLDYNAARLQRVAGSPGTNPRQLADGSIGLSGSYASTQAGWFRSVDTKETELHAARSRISQLEAHVKILEAQLVSKDEAIRALTEANIASMAVLSKSQQHIGNHPESIFNSPPNPQRGDTNGLLSVSSSSRLAKLHQEVATELNTEIVSALNTRPAAVARMSSTAHGGGEGGVATPLREPVAASSVGSSESSKLSSPALRQLLERHQQRCQQLLA